MNIAQLFPEVVPIPMLSSTFRPLRGADNPHVQTLLPRLIRRRARLQPVWQQLDLPDGDFVDLAWSEAPQGACHKPRVVLFHGLEGSFHSPYAHGLLQACRQQGWLAVIMHFRGCSGRPNRLNRIYHSGETDDGSYLLRWMRDTLGDVPTAAIGISLGGNMLACLLAKREEARLLCAAAIVSAPFHLDACSRRIEQGFSRIYQRYLVGQLKQNARRKLARYPGSLPIIPAQLQRIKGLREFDDAITARIHGFQDAADYYHQCSALALLPTIRTPTLIIHAQDDPFMTPEVIPNISHLPDTIEYQLTAHGGHVGFVGGTLLKPEMWLEQRIPDWFYALFIGGHRRGNSMMIPWQQLDSDTLQNIIESFVLREGTDYGEQERSLEEKVRDIRRQLASGDVVLVWSELHETLNIMPRTQLNENTP